MPRAFDTTPWTAKLSHRDLRAFMRSEKAAGRASQANPVPWIAWATLAAGWLFVAVGFWAIWESVKGQSLIGLLFESIWVILAAIGYLFLLVLTVIGTCGLVAFAIRRWPSYYRAAHFAEANRLLYTADDESVTARSTVLGLGLDTVQDPNVAHPHIRASFSSQDEPGFEIGDYGYSSVRDGREFLPSWGYMRVRLPKSYPHIVFRERRGESVPWPQTGWQDLPTPQLLAPELTDFYTLHCPVEYQGDARAIFTAELILALKKRPKGRDTYIEGEILDDQLWIYQYGLPFNLNRAKNIRPAFDILAIALKAQDATTEAQRPGGPRAREA